MKHSTIVAVILLCAGFGAAQDVAASPEQRQPTLVTLHVHGVPMQQALEQITGQTGVAFGVRPEGPQGNEPLVTIDADSKPFWEVVVDIAQQASLELRPGGSNMRSAISLVRTGRQNRTATPRFSSSGVMFLADRATRTHTVNYGRTGGPTTNFAIRLRTFPDPKWQVCRYPQELEVSEAVDDKGNSLLVVETERTAQGRRMRTQGPNYGVNWYTEIDAPLRYLPEQGATLKTLKGQARFEVASKEHVWEINQLADAAGQKCELPGLRYTIEGLTSPGERSWVLKVLIDSDAPMARNSPENPLSDYNVLQRGLHMYDELGREMQSAGGGGGPRSERSFFYEFHFYIDGSGGEPAATLPGRLVWHIPLETAEIVVPVEFSDLAIP